MAFSESENSIKMRKLVVSSKLDNIDVTIFLGNSYFEVPECTHIENENGGIIVVDYIALSCPDMTEKRRKFIAKTNIMNHFEVAKMLEGKGLTEEMIKIITEICTYQMVPDRTLKSLMYLENNGSEHNIEIRNQK